MKKGNNYERLERCNKKELIEKIIVRDKHCNDLKDLLATGLEKYKLLEKENKLLEQAINELMVQCDIKYFRFRDKEFYKQEYGLNFSSKKK